MSTHMSDCQQLSKATQMNGWLWYNPGVDATEVIKFDNITWDCKDSMHQSSIMTYWATTGLRTIKALQS